MGSLLPLTKQDALYDNAKFRRRSLMKVATQGIVTSSLRRNCRSCSTGKVLVLLLIVGLGYLFLFDPSLQASKPGRKGLEQLGGDSSKGGRFRLTSLLKRKAPNLPPQLDQTDGKRQVWGNSTLDAQDELLLRFESLQVDALWGTRQAEVAEAFKHAWSGYKTYAMGYDELEPVSRKGVDGLGGLGATIVDALDTAMIMKLEDIVEEAGSWVEHELPGRIKDKGQVNLFETTIRVLGGLLSAYHLSGGGGTSSREALAWGTKGSGLVKGPQPDVYLERAKDLADRLMTAFTSSPTAIPFADVFLKEKRARAGSSDGGASSTAEVATLQLEFGYLSEVTGNPEYKKTAMRVYEHMKNLPKDEGLVPIYVSPHTGQFYGNNIRLGSRGDSYYEYLLKVWLQQGGADAESVHVAYLRDMYDEAMKGMKHLLVRKSSPNGLVFVGELPAGARGGFSPKMDHLVCFLAGNLALGATRGLTRKQAEERNALTERDLEDLKLAEELGETCFQMYAVTATGIAPEIVYFNTDGDVRESGGDEKPDYKQDILIKSLDHHNLLRPETVESLFILYRITESAKYREWGWKIFQAFESHAKVASGGYSSLNDVTVVPPPKRDKQETFFLGETLKYLYLLFGDKDLLPLTQIVFNTEAHPIPRKPTGAGKAS